MPFDGDKELLEFKPNPYTMWTVRIFLKSNCICFNIDYTNDSQRMFNEIDRIKKMINDIFYSQNINLDFRKKYLIKSEPNFYIKILSQDSWPFDDYIKNEIKAIIVRGGYTMQEVLEKLRDDYGWSDSLSNLSAKLQRESIRYREVIELADVLGYDIVWQNRRER